MAMLAFATVTTPETRSNRRPSFMARSSLSRPVVPDIAGSSVDRRRRVHERHRPEETLLYKLVAEHIETFLAESREKHDRPHPTYVERELRAYLRCGILAHGFGHAVSFRVGPWSTSPPT
jgi:hypothetical protein